MKTPAPPNHTVSPAHAVIDDLYALTLHDGLPVQAGEREVRYRFVRLRETTVADERKAQQLSERVAYVGGQPKLLTSEAEFRFAMTMMHIEAFECDGAKLPRAVIDLEVMGKLTPHDLALIEARVFLVTMAAELRYGAITQAQFDALLLESESPQRSPQPAHDRGPAGAVGQADDESGRGPELLAVYAGGAAAGTPQSPGQAAL